MTKKDEAGVAEMAQEFLGEKRSPLFDVLDLAAQAHGTRMDRTNILEFAHPVRVMLRIFLKAVKPDEFAINQLMVALLHDTLEDTELTVADMVRLGVPQPVIDAIQTLTHRDGEPYRAYMDRVATNELAAQTKPFDMWDNQTRKGNKRAKLAGRVTMLTKLTKKAEQYHER